LATSDTDLTLDFKASGPNLNEWLVDQIRTDRTGEAFKYSAKLRAVDSSLKISDLKLDIRDATLRGNITSGWPDHPEQLSFDLTAKGKNMAEELPVFMDFQPAAVAFNVKARGNLDETHIELDDFDATIGSAVAKINGKVSIPPAVSAESLSIDIRGDKLADLGTITGWEIKDNSFAITATINADGNSIKTDDVELQLGPNDLSGQFTYETGDKPNLNIDISSKLIDIGAVLTKEQNTALNATLGSSASADGSDDTSKSASKGNGKVIPDVDLPVNFLGAVNGQLKLQIDKINIGNRGLNVDVRGLTSFAVTATLKDGTLDIPDLAADTKYGNIKGSLNLQPGAETYVHELNMDLNGIRFADMLASVTDKYPYKGHNVDAWLKASGTNLRDIAASLDGYFWMRGGQRQVENVRFSSMFGDFFTGVLKRINPYSETDPYTTIVCDMYFFGIDKGKMQTAPFIVIKTDKLNVFAAGTIDLSSEHIKLGIEVNPRKGVGISVGDLVTPFVMVSGTLAEPRAGFDTTGSIIEGGAAYATLGLSIIAKSIYKRWLKKDRSCPEYTDKAREVGIKHFPAHMPTD
jgi:hypothetical protein